MTFLAPWALLAVASLGPVLWVWRLAATRRQIEVPSLAPFAHLLKRAPQHRHRLRVNLLFWLQVAALLLLTAALMRPVWWGAPAATTLIILDTSASLSARAGAGTALEEAKRRARDQAGAARGARFVIATAPVAPLTPEPTADAAEARDAVDAASLGELGGSVATAAHIGQALLGRRPERVLVVTDEPTPEALPPGVEFFNVGAPLPNVAFVGLEAQRSLCGLAPERIMATLQNFADEPAAVRVLARHEGRTVAEASVELAARERRSVPLRIAEPADGFMDVTLRASDDAMPLDNAARVPIRRAAAWPVFVRSEDPAFVRRIGGWLTACEGLAWQSAAPPSGAYVAVTDDPARVPPEAAAAVVFAGAGAQLSVSHWFAAEHPVAAYLPPIMPVAASLAAPRGAPEGEPAVWGIAGGERVPVATAAHDHGRRVTLHLDPLKMPAATPLVLLFYNSLRWVMDQAEATTTGEPLTLPSLPAGRVTVERPDGRADRIEHPGGAFRYAETTRAGLYTIRAGDAAITRAVNFLDPQESNLLERASTWRPLPEPAPGTPRPRIPQPLAKSALAAALFLLLVEWWWYLRRRRQG